MNVLFQLIALGAIVSGGIVALWLLAGMTVKAARMFWLIRILFPYLYGVSTMVVLFSMMLASRGQSWSIFLSLFFLFLVVLAVRLPDDLLNYGAEQSQTKHLKTER